MRFSPTGALTDLSPGGSESRGANDNGSITGWGFANPIFPCEMNALFWQTSVSSAFNLGTVFPIEPGDQTRAEAITNPDGGIMLVVGSNETTQLALRWQGSGQTWTVVDLNTKIVNQCFGTEGFIVVQAHDVSNDGWIIALADDDPNVPGVQPHAVILVPDQDCQVCCFADLDCDGTVGVKDLLILLGAWGPCLGCPADLDCDGTVGVLDLLILLGEWGPCGTPIATTPPQSIQDCMDRFCCAEEDLLALEKCICSVDPECEPTASN